MWLNIDTSEWDIFACMQQSSNTARTLAQSSGFEQTETAGSSISEHPAATSGGGWYQEGLYRDKAAREASMSAICGKLDAKSIIYWLKRTVQEIRWTDRKQPFERVFVWMPEPEASLQTQAETWTVHLGKDASGCSKCSRSQRELWNQLRA